MSHMMEACEGLRWRVVGWASNLGEIWNPGAVWAAAGAAKGSGSI